MPTVLIVDDSKDTRWELKNYFKLLGWTVVAEAENGLEALDAYIRVRPDLVSLDIVMPVLDGLSALQEIKKFDATAAVLLVSSALNERTIHQAKNLGANGFVHKPVTVENLKAALAHFEIPHSEPQNTRVRSGGRRG